jgi:tetratricopeptide (TPR) repeat protein
MCLRSSFLLLISLFALFFGTGCERNEAIPFAGEDSEPNFERGKQLIRQGRNQEALSAFLKVIAKRGDEAPESYLEAGLLYQQHIKDHIAAIYYFRKYLELQPNSRQADLVAKRIEASTREFARTLPGHPMENQSVKLGFMDQLDSLKRENEQLKSELSALRAGMPAGSSSYPRSGFEIPIAQSTTPAPKTTVAEEPSPQVAEETPPSPVSRAPLVSESAASSNARITFEEPTRPSAASNAAAANRKHTVGPGDTLYSLAQKYYGNRSRWRDILSANRDQLKSDSDKLRIGMELKIP